MEIDIKKFKNEIFLSIILISINIFFSDINYFINYIFFSIYIFIECDSRIYNPFLYIFAGVIYLLPILRRYSFYEIFEFNQFINLIIIGVLIFSIIHKFGSNLEKRIPRFSKINYRRNDLILIISYFLYAIIRINILNIEGDIFKGISFLTSTFISGSIFGSLIAISKKNLIESYIKSIPYMLLLISQNIFINDNSSRIYALFYFVLIYSITIASRKNLIFSISFKLKKIINQIIFKIFYVVTLLFFLSFKSILTGGDYLIVENALNIMRIANSYKNFEPFMPFHNGLFIYFPQKILPFVKPENYGIKDQIQMFYSAKKIVGLHGAGFANICFCNPKTKIKHQTN